MEYQHGIHGLDVLPCGEDGVSGQQGMNHHVNPGEWHKHKIMDETVIVIVESCYKVRKDKKISSLVAEHLVGGFMR
jgi:hypothetical protein